MTTIVPTTRIIEIQNWMTTSEFFNLVFFEKGLYAPFRILVGWKEEITSEGYSPEDMLVNNNKTINPSIIFELFRIFIVISLSINELNKGKINITINTAKENATTVKIKDSNINCFINCFRTAPTTFLIPISFDLFEARAVVRFI